MGTFLQGLTGRLADRSRTKRRPRTGVHRSPQFRRVARLKLLDHKGAAVSQHGLATLVHYTSLESAIKILRNGAFWFVPNRRHVLGRLLPGEDLGPEEPQRYGAVSFTRLEPTLASAHRQAFGTFGIGVSETWAQVHGAQPVIYIPEDGPAVQELRFLFETGLREVRINRAKQQGVPAPIAEMGQSIHNKRVAALFDQARLWHSVLTLFEYMELAEHSAQQEWRIVQQVPFAFNSDDREGQLGEAAEDEGRWRLRQLAFEATDVEYVVCPARERRSFISSLPRSFRKVPVQEI